MIQELKDAIKWHNDKDYFMIGDLRDDRQDSIWYDDLLYLFDYKGYEFSVHAYGEIAFYYKGERYYSIYDTDIENDKQLYDAIDNGELDFINNNWYELFVDKIDDKGRVIEEIDNFVIDEITDCLDKNWIDELIEEE